ncbi:hypothetical protein BN59_01416 [Legionella massiliensis]|uniref:Uncharacterized protein n=1 Tax=Legionella massiliensis TaxID=1034943 RepID=A0A078KZC6_9GAMM|nr:hypothetical protein [Legionella massiliensis]CDZ77134.1 hypothetical protein BN59_01416 [Legionella massiliensis]CEE12872.1 hypothetical protein BN1094_01416 [Legionella massiliensis]
MPSTIVPIGTYTIKSKHKAQADDFIISPGAQSCVVLVLESPHAIAVAHIDAPSVAAKITSSMLKELEKMGAGVISARLYGGDYGNPLRSSSDISNPIYAELTKLQISYSHKDYQLTSGFVMAIATAIWASSAYGPESQLFALACVGLAYKATSLLKAAVPTKWAPGFLGENIDVSVNVKTGFVQLVKDQRDNSLRLLSQARDSLIAGGQWRHIEKRMNLNPQDPGNESALAILRV